MPKKTHFPLFVSTKGKRVVVVGGGNVAARRVETLLRFDFDLLVVSPCLCMSLLRLMQENDLRWEKACYNKEQLQEAFLVLACTDDRTVNRQIGADAKAQNCFVSIADCRREGDFFFPAVIGSEDITVGLVGKGDDHHKVREVANRIRRQFKEEIK